MNVYEGIAAIMRDVEAIKKDKRNQQQNFNFRGIDDVYNAVHPLFARHGVFTIPTVLEERTEERTTRSGSNLIYRILRIKYTFYSEDGTSLDAVVIGEGMDSGDKASNKAMAVAHKYALLQALQIPTEDMIDPDSESPEQSSPKGSQQTIVYASEAQRKEMLRLVGEFGDATPEGKRLKAYLADNGLTWEKAHSTIASARRVLEEKRK